MTARPTRHRLRRAADCLGALLAAGLALTLSVSGLGPVPALGPVLNTGTGVWRLSPDAGPAGSESIELRALEQAGTIAFEPSGTPHLTARTDQDLFRLMGYVHARYRLVQMDLERRQASAELSEILGDGALDSDRLELDLGLRRSAQRDWDQLPAGDPARTALTSYAEGVNAAIDQLVRTHQLPPVIKLLGYTPRPWTPVDSLAVQRLMTQTLSFSDTALTFSYASKALPVDVFNDWFPEVFANPQVPYDTGPYKKLPLAPLPVRADTAPGGQIGTMEGHGMDRLGDPFAPRTTPAALPFNAVHYVGNSNAWVVSGSRTESGKPILAADPHLQLTLPSAWYQMEGRSPGYHFTAITLPGIPAPLMGKTDRFSWGATNAQRPTTLFYLPKTDPAKPGQYFYKGSWQPLSTQTYSIKVKGQGSVTHRVNFTAQGPIITMQGVTAAVWYAGALPSDNLNSVLKLLRATSFSEFRDSLRGWVTPALNFLYAGQDGDIGALNPGVAPQVPGHTITLPMPADGSADVAGSIPFEALPQVLNPPSGFIVSANNREVTAEYPYQGSSSYNFADAGYRAQRIAEVLAKPGKLTLEQNAKLQADVVDTLAQDMVPEILKALAGRSLSSQEQQVVQLLRDWNFEMVQSSPQAYFFQKFIVAFVFLTLQSWWGHYKIPDDPLKELPISLTGGSFSSQIMYGNLLVWMKRDPENKYFTTADGTKRTAGDLIDAAFRLSVKRVSESLGPDVRNWEFGKHNMRRIPSLLQVDAFDIGPFPSDSNGRCVNSGVPVISSAGTGGSSLLNDTTTVDTHTWTVITTGASWRFVHDLGTGKAAAVLPGGSSENPISPWYSNGVAPWLKGELLPVLENASADQAAPTQWRFTP